MQKILHPILPHLTNVLSVCLFVCIFFTKNSLAQAPARPTLSAATDSLLHQIECDIRNGNLRAFRDLGSLLNKPSIQDTARALLQKYSLFTEGELALSTCNRADFMRFFYENSQQLHFSELLHVFYLSPLETHTGATAPALPPEELDNHLLQQLNQHIAQYAQALSDKELEVCIRSVQKIGTIPNDAASIFLQKQLQNNIIHTIFQQKSAALYHALLAAAATNPKLETFTAALQLLEKGQLSIEATTPQLAQLSNHAPPPNHKVLDFYKGLLDSLHTLPAIRAAGYQAFLTYQPLFFYKKIDYYGKIFCQDYLPKWVHDNARIDMLRTKHPRSLLYLAAYLYKHRFEPEVVAYERQRFERLTKTTVPVNETDFKPFLYYWWQNYEQFEWQPTQYFFVNKQERVARMDAYEKLFRRLNSRNDSVAMASYRTLTLGRPDEVRTLAQKFRPLLRNANKTLPDLKAYYLENLAALTTFCRENNYTYQLPTSIAILLDSLAQPLSPAHRYALENRCIEQMALATTTAVEYHTILQARNRPLNLSVGRILDYVYTRHWEAVVTHTAPLRLYLKKAQLFADIGVSGTCNDYLEKFDTSEPQQQALQQLLDIETDGDIKKQLLQVLEKKHPTMSAPTASFTDFLNTPSSFEEAALQVLPKPSPKKWKTLLKAIQKEPDPIAVQKYFEYIHYHADKTVVPLLFKYIRHPKIGHPNKDTTLTVTHRMVAVLENIYNYSFEHGDSSTLDPTPWIQLWKSDEKNYLRWEAHFAQAQLDKLRQRTELNIKEVNHLLQTHATETHIRACLSLLPKVQPTSDIRRLDVGRPLRLTDELRYFEAFDWSYKQLDDIPKLFDINEPVRMLDFLDTQMQFFDRLEQGAFLNNLFEATWFLEEVLEGRISEKRVQTYTKILQYYLDESDYLSEYEEQRTLQNLNHLKSIGLPLATKLEMALALDAGPQIRMNIQQNIIARIDYEDISTIADYLPYLDGNRQKHPADFLHQDFGVPLFRPDEIAIQQLKKRHQSLSEFDFYKAYLLDFGVDFLDNEGQLDFKKIDHILTHDIVSPLTGTGGGTRDDYVYGIIKLLEIHFDTRLGFHEKLNESQTFYTFTSNKRAAAWRAYLAKKQKK